MRRDKGAKYVAETKPPERFARNGREKERGRKRETERNASTEGLRETESPPNFSVRSRARFSRGRFRCFDFELGLKGAREKERERLPEANGSTLRGNGQMVRGLPRFHLERNQDIAAGSLPARSKEKPAALPFILPSPPSAGKCTEGKSSRPCRAIHPTTGREVRSQSE